MFHSRLCGEQPMIYNTLLKVKFIDRQHVYIKCIWKVFTAFSYVTALLHNGWMDGLHLLKIKNSEITCTYCKYSQPSVVLKPLLWLAVHLGLLSCWKTNRCPTLRSRAFWSSISSRMCLYIAAFIFPSILTGLPVPAAEKHPHSLMLPPPGSLEGSLA